jgi:hypothetical protein
MPENGLPLRMIASAPIATPAAPNSASRPAPTEAIEDEEAHPGGVRDPVAVDDAEPALDDRDRGESGEGGGGDEHAGAAHRARSEPARSCPRVPDSRRSRGRRSACAGCGSGCRAARDEQGSAPRVS